MNPPPAPGPHAALPPAAAPPPYRRDPLGLPAGSVRALLTFMVLAMFAVLLLSPEDTPEPIPLYLYFLLFLILGHYFAARANPHTPAGAPGRHPLFLPRGAIRFLVVVGFVAVFAWGYYSDPRFVDRLKLPALEDQPFL